MKTCPFCAEDIQAEDIQDGAIKCRWCGEFLTELPAMSDTGAVATPSDRAIEATLRAQGWHHHDYWSHRSA